jgi:hypothetical protein
MGPLLLVMDKSLTIPFVLGKSPKCTKHMFQPISH